MSFYEIKEKCFLIKNTLPNSKQQHLVAKPPKMQEEAEALQVA